MIKKIKIRCKGTRYIPLNNFLSFHGNLKELGKGEYHKLWKSMEMKGFRFPTFIWEDHNYILDGHQRIFVLKDMVKAGFRIENLPAIDIEADSEREAKELVLLIASRYGKVTDDGLYEFIMEGGLDFNALKETIDLPEINLKEFEESYFPNEPKDAEPQIDRAEELNKKWQVKTGDLWQIGEHRLLCGDSTKREDVERVMRGETACLMVTDPPYGVEYKPEWRAEIISIGKSRALGKVLNDDRASWSAAYSLSNAPVAYVWHAGIFAGIVQRALEAAGFEIRTQIVWVKKSFPISRGNYHYAHEPCWHAARKGKNTNFVGGRKKTTIWGNIIDTFLDRAEPLFATMLDKNTIYAFSASQTTVWEIPRDIACEGGHSTQKPQECMARPIRNHGKIGDIVYDPFLGSGTTMVACQNLNRKCRGMEISPPYCAIILERMATAFPGIEIKRI
jgi:DNA modification methylase